MDALRKKYHQWRSQSRDTRFLVRGAVVILLVFAVIGLVVRGLVVVTGHDSSTMAEAIAAEASDLDRPSRGDGNQDNDRDGDKDSPLGMPESFADGGALYQAIAKREQAIAERDWVSIFRWQAWIDVLALKSPMFFLSLFAGTVWAIVIAQFAGFSRSQLLLYALALVLGGFSATLTIVALIFQEMRGITEAGSLLDQLIFWIAGVGLREELAKLLCFAPLLVFLRKREAIDALVCGGMVGLGFAIQENINYFDAAGPANALGRMMTANFIHLGLTAIAARALFRLIKWPRKCWEEFLATFIGVVLVHGLYDAVLSIPEVSEYGGLLSLVVIAGIAYYFCTMAGAGGRLRPGRSFSPVAVLVFGLALLTGGVYVFLCFYIPPGMAAVLCGESLIGVFVFAAIFISRLHEY